MSNIRELPNELAKIARDELNEIPDRIDEDLDTLRNWIRQNPHLIARMDDQFLIAFLRGCKYSLERAKQKLDLFYTVRQQTPEIIRNRDPKNERIIGMIRQGFGLPLPELENSASPRVVLVRPGIFDPAEYTIQDAMKVTTMMLDILLNEDDNFVVSGQLCVLDLAGVTLQHFLQYSPSFIKKMVVITQDAAPGRLKGIHWINCPRGFEQVFSLFTSFMSDKNKSRLYVHNNLESLHKSVSKKLLPKEYGGEAGSIDSIISLWEKRIEAFGDYYREEEKFGTNEAKRVDQQKSSSNIYGAEGSFRQLTID